MGGRGARTSSGKRRALVGPAVASAMAAVTVAVLPASLAGAATVEVGSGGLDPRTMVRFDAGAGEANDVIVEWDETGVGAQTVRLVTIRDGAATLVAGDQCASLDAHTVRCMPILPPHQPVVYVDLDLGDADDRARVSTAGVGPTAGVLYADGGAGDDVLDGRNVLMAGLDGGGGRDSFYGARAYSYLSDGDRDDASGEGAPGPDTFHGGRGEDTVGYRQRSASIQVDLTDRGGDGAPGEGDVLRGIESVEGGSGPDVLAGDRNVNILNGGPGRDRLSGRGGNDRFGTVTSTPYEPLPASAVGDVVRCGSGHYDVVTGRRMRDFTPRSCEQVQLPEERRGGRMYQPAYPVADGSALLYRHACRDPEYPYPKCSGTLVLRSPSGTVLARGHSKRGRDKPFTLFVIQVTARGRALATRRGGVLARVQFEGRNLPRPGWTIRLRLGR